MRIIFALPALLVPLSSAAAQQIVMEPSGTVTTRATAPSPVAGVRWDAVPYVYGTTAPIVPGADGRIATLAGLPTELDSGRTWSITGAVVGAIVGAAVGGALGCLANRDDYGVYCGGQSDTKVVIGAVLGAGAGAWIGAVLPRRLR